MINESASKRTTIQNPRLKTAANDEIYCIRGHLKKYLQLSDWHKQIINEAIEKLHQLNGGQVDNFS